MLKNVTNTLIKLAFSLLLLLGVVNHTFAEPLHEFSLTNTNIATNFADNGSWFVVDSSVKIPQKYSEMPSWLAGLTPLGEMPIMGGEALFVVKLRNETGLKEQFLYPYNIIVDQITSYLISSEGVTSHLTGSQFQREIDFHYGNHVHIEPDRAYYLVMHFKSDYFYTPLKLSLHDVTKFKRKATLENILMLICFGFGVALGLYNLLIYFGSKDVTHFYYALFTACWVFAWSHFFLIPSTLTGQNYSSLHWIGFILLPLTNAAFYVNLLKLNEVNKRLAKIALGLGFVSLVGIPFSMAEPGVGLLWASLVTGLGMMIGLYIGVKSVLQGFKPARYFVLAYLAMLIPNMIANATNFGLLPSTDLNLYLLGLIGTTMDALLLAFAVADKLRLINNENIELNVNLEHKVDERTKALSQLTNELQDANEAKSRFLANMSHEIRTPMTSIIGYAEGLMHGDIEKSQVPHAVKVISQNGKHVLGLINDILDMSKIEANKLEIETLPTELFSILQELNGILQRQINAKGLDFTIQYAFPLPSRLFLDPTRVRQILLNLTNNAIKFTKKGSITLAVSFYDGRLRVAVTDTGKGMGEEELQKLFTPFSQGDASVTRKFGGTGLGLHISKSLAERMGGDITVTSSVGHGTCFTLVIPCVFTSDSQWLYSHDDVEKALTVTQPKQTNVFDQSLLGTILLAEDHPDNRLLIKRMLEKMGLEVTAVENGEQALAATLETEFDLILLDIQMPVMDGLTALDMMAATGCTTPVIALTANAMKEDKALYFQKGFIDHIAKPIDRNEFCSKISCYLGIDATDIHLPEEEMAKLRSGFISSVEGYLLQLEQIIASDDFAKLGQLAHAIKGAAGMFGFSTISDCASELESELKQDKPIEHAVNLLKTALQEALN